MNFEIFWDPKAVSQLRKLPILKEHEYGFKIRIGDYRALCDIYYNPGKVIIRVVEHRKNVYKNFDEVLT